MLFDVIVTKLSRISIKIAILYFIIFVIITLILEVNKLTLKFL